MLERKLWNGEPVGQNKVLGCIEFSGDERCITYGAAIVMITAALCMFIVPFILVQHHRRQVAQNFLKHVKQHQLSIQQQEQMILQQQQLLPTQQNLHEKHQENPKLDPIKMKHLENSFGKLDASCVGLKL